MTMNVLVTGWQTPARSPASQVVLGAALLAMVVGSAYASVPLPFGPVPMTLQSLAVLLAGFWGGPRLGAAVCAAYLGLGAAGLPVFAGGTAAPGLALLAHPAAGYLLAFPAAAAVAGVLATALPQRLIAAATAMVAGHVVIFLGGLSYLCAFMPPGRAVAVGLAPFAAGTAVKVALGTALALLGHSSARG